MRVTGADGGTDVATKSITVSDSTATVTAAPALLATGETATLDASASALPDSAVTAVAWDFDGDGTWDGSSGTSLTTDHVYTTAGDLTPTVRVTRSGGRTDVATTNVDVRVAPPSGLIGVSINGGATFTNDPNVTVSVVWPRLSKLMWRSNDGGFSGASPIPVTSTSTWTLPSAGSERLPKTVYVKFGTTAAGIETVQDDIILDQTAPAITSSTARGTLVVTKRGGLARDARRVQTRVALTAVAKDAVSGVASIQVTANKRAPGSWSPYRARTSTLLSGTPQSVFVRVRDNAGNVSAWRTVKVGGRRR